MMRLLFPMHLFQEEDIPGRMKGRNQILWRPGVNVRTTAVGGGVTVVSGTSFATPFVTGASALLMEWGIVRGNDPFLYGEKVKAYRPARGERAAGI